MLLHRQVDVVIVKQTGEVLLHRQVDVIVKQTGEVLLVITR